MTEKYTAYPGEEEVLIQDGLSYRVLENTTKEANDGSSGNDDGAEAAAAGGICAEKYEAMLDDGDNITIEQSNHCISY